MHRAREVASGKCRGKDKFLYVKGGVVKNVFGWGATSLYGEYYKGWRNQNLSDDELVRPLELNPEQAVELESSVQKVWGVGVMQTIDPTRPGITQPTCIWASGTIAST